MNLGTSFDEEPLSVNVKFGCKVSVKSDGFQISRLTVFKQNGLRTTSAVHWCLLFSLYSQFYWFGFHIGCHSMIDQYRMMQYMTAEYTCDEKTGKLLINLEFGCNGWVAQHTLHYKGFSQQILKHILILSEYNNCKGVFQVRRTDCAAPRTHSTLEYEECRRRLPEHCSCHEFPETDVWRIWLVGVLLVSRFGLVEEDAVEVFHYYGFHLSSSFSMYNFKFFRGK